MRIEKEAMWRFIWITIGVVLMGLSMTLFMVPNKIAPGGVSGLATVLHHLWNLPTGAIILVINLPLFLLAIKNIGKWFAIIALYASFLTSVVVDYIPVPVLTTNPMLACVFGGALMGVGLGLIERNGGNTGGTYLAAKLLQKPFRFISVAWLMFFIDCFVVALSAIVFSMEQGLYSMVALFLSTKIMDAMVEGIHSARAVYIITDQWEKIGWRIMEELERGVTKMQAVGMYSGGEKGMLLCVLETNRELSALKDIVKSEDESAFMVVNTAGEVMGEGFAGKP
ncbi:YitT family protein [Eubacteriales bacterium OttesenSCG-928-M02]|nr:YitT family protein [Eubacteriales bacterium OttesenSCG-928-M02]